LKYSLKRKGSVSRTIIRVGCGRLEHALKSLRKSDRTDAIHSARKDIKKTRAVLRLASGRIKRKKLRRLKRQLQWLAGELADSRDAYVKSITLQKVIKRFKKQLSSQPLERLHQSLQRTSDEKFQRFSEKENLQRLEDCIHQTHEEFQVLEVTGRGWDVIETGLAETYQRGRLSLLRVCEEPSAENVHDWRKRAKTLGYQINLLTPISPEQLEPVAADLDVVGERLGDHHDLDVLMHDVETSGELDPKTFEELQRLISGVQKRLCTSALRVGRRLYSETTSRYCDRLARLWVEWGQTASTKRRGSERVRHSRPGNSPIPHGLVTKT